MTYFDLEIILLNSMPYHNSCIISRIRKDDSMFHPLFFDPVSIRAIQQTSQTAWLSPPLSRSSRTFRRPGGKRGNRRAGTILNTLLDEPE